MACCCTWVTVQACWLLRAPSLSRGSSQHLLRLGCFLPGHSHKLLLSKHSPASLLFPSYVSVSPFVSLLLPDFRVAVIVRWAASAGLWHSSSGCAPSLILSPLSLLPSSSSASLPLTLPLVASPSFVEFVTSESTQKQLLVHTYVAFDIIWISQMFGSTAWWALKCLRPFLWERLHHLHLLWI